ncbi:hypothetical protein THASP1DRAFT_29594 [Thamnocephalis sphaerospora]|uniref:RFX-type winged-helix domain-containing protein n=1 Tax=Thamnocephalis sphaerospora TaxID=78915 RepID=A0A4V1IWS8_9FUNG|nr:hypothetical protein THASP1DRAFT_29594 [Thamnocephalis sphaerospora]|eukprot:RKP08609.1 hypothetical protein THASP1DRAFT_29594 [Thamnocephalis sphaerospora]
MATMASDTASVATSADSVANSGASKSSPWLIHGHSHVGHPQHTAPSNTLSVTLAPSVANLASMFAPHGVSQVAVGDNPFAQLGLWFDRYPTPTEAAMASACNTGMNGGSDVFTQRRAAQVDTTAAPAATAAAAAMRSREVGAHDTTLPLLNGPPSSLPKTATPTHGHNMFGMGFAPSCSTASPVPSTAAAAAAASMMMHGCVPFDSLLAGTGAPLDTLPAASEIHACLEASFGQPVGTMMHPMHGRLMLPGNGMDGSSVHAPIGTVRASSMVDYPRSVATLAGHGSAASDRSTKKAQLDETQQWLRDNFEPCHPKYSILRTKFYELYQDHAQSICDPLEPMNQATFGKIIHQVFENVQTRRLGQRGHSKYHYSGVMPRRDSPLWADADDIIHCDPNYFVSDSRQRSQQQRQMQMAAVASGTGRSSERGSTNGGVSASTPASLADSSSYFGGEQERHLCDPEDDDGEDDVERQNHLQRMSAGFHYGDDGAIGDGSDDEEEEEHAPVSATAAMLDIPCAVPFDGFTVCPSLLTRSVSQSTPNTADAMSTEKLAAEASAVRQLEELLAAAAGCGTEMATANAAAAKTAAGVAQRHGGPGSEAQANTAATMISMMSIMGVTPNAMLPTTASSAGAFPADPTRTSSVAQKAGTASPISQTWVEAAAMGKSLSANPAAMTLRPGLSAASDDQMDAVAMQLLPWLPRTFADTHSGRAALQAGRGGDGDAVATTDVRSMRLARALLDEYAKHCRLITLLVLQGEFDQVPALMRRFWQTTGQHLRAVVQQPAVWQDLLEADCAWYAACTGYYHRCTSSGVTGHRVLLERFFEECPRWAVDVAACGALPDGLLELKLRAACQFSHGFRAAQLVASADTLVYTAATPAATPPHAGGAAVPGMTGSSATESMPAAMMAEAMGANVATRAAPSGTNRKRPSPMLSIALDNSSSAVDTVKRRREALADGASSSAIASPVSATASRAALAMSSRLLDEEAGERAVLTPTKVEGDQDSKMSPSKEQSDHRAGHDAALAQDEKDQPVQLGVSPPSPPQGRSSFMPSAPPSETASSLESNKADRPGQCVA